MRQIGSLESEVLARRFVDYLKTISVSAQSEEDDGRWMIWVKDENQVELSRESLSEFEADPNSERYKDADLRANEIRAAEIKKRIETKKNFQQVRSNWSGPLSKRAPIVLGLIIACIAAAILGGGFGGQTSVARLLMFADIVALNDLDASNQGDVLYNIKRGEVWRIVTPIFLHGGPLHILFNLYWLYSLGQQIEPKIGKVRFLLLVLATAAIPNLMQAFLTGPNFLGISGVVYGLFAFMWIRRRDGYLISEQTMMFVMGWFVLGFILPGMRMAVWAHGGGLAVGAAIAYLPDWLQSQRRR